MRTALAPLSFEGLSSCSATHKSDMEVQRRADPCARLVEMLGEPARKSRRYQRYSLMILAVCFSVAPWASFDEPAISA